MNWIKTTKIKEREKQEREITKKCQKANHYISKHDTKQQKRELSDVIKTILNYTSFKNLLISSEHFYMFKEWQNF